MNEQDTWDAFFGLAAAGYIASFAGYDTGETTMAPPEDVADYAAKCADAMMAERGKRIEKRAVEWEALYAEARGFRSGLLRAAEECEGYAAVVADEYDDGPHSVHADVARHLARELREIADRDAPAMQPDPPPSAEARANRLRAMLDEAMSEYPSLRVKFAKELKAIGGG